MLRTAGLGLHHRSSARRKPEKRLEMALSGLRWDECGLGLIEPGSSWSRTMWPDQRPSSVPGSPPNLGKLVSESQSAQVQSEKISLATNPTRSCETHVLD